MWHTFSNLEQAKRNICTAYGSGKIPFRHVPFLETMVTAKDYLSILDFGCGVGRNIAFLANEAPEAHIVGYDFPNMVTLAKEYLGEETWETITWIHPPLDNLVDFAFDLIVATIVFQHLPTNDLKAVLPFLRDRLQGDGILFVHSRGYLDQGGNIWPHLLECFDPLTALDPTKKDETHQAVIFKAKP